MRSLALLVAGIPVLAFAWSAASRAYRLALLEAKEVKALRLAEEFPPFARAYANVLAMAGVCHATPPWKRPEAESRHVYVIGGRA